MFNSSILRGQYPYAGACLGDDAFYFIKTEEGSTFAEALGIQEQAFNIKDTLGILSSGQEYALTHYITSHFNLTNVWLGVEVNLDFTDADSTDEFYYNLELNIPEDKFFYSFNNFEFELEDPSKNKNFNFEFNDFNSHQYTVSKDDTYDLPAEGGITIYNNVYQIDAYGDDVDDFDDYRARISNDDAWIVEDKTELVGGFLHKEKNSDLCLNARNNDVSNGDLFVKTFRAPRLDEGVSVCADAENDVDGRIGNFTSFTSKEEFDAITEALIFHRDITDIPGFSKYLLNLKFNAANVQLDEQNCVTNLRNLIDSDEQLGSDVFNALSDLTCDFVEIDNVDYAYVLIYRAGEVNLRLFRQNDVNDFHGFLCRNIGSKSSEEAPTGVFILFGLVIVFAGFSMFLVFKLQESRKKNKENEKNILEGQTGLLTLHPDTKTYGGYGNNDDKFSIISGITDLQRRRSFGEASIASRKTEITAVDKNNDKMVKSVISNRSEFSAMSKKLLSVSPFVKNVGNNTELLVFYQRVEDYFAAQIVNDEEREETDESFLEFNAEQVPNIPINFYLKRLINGLNMWFNEYEEGEEDEFIGIRALLLALHLINKVNQTHPITKYNIHKLISTTLLVGVKFIEDEIITNEFWADISGIDSEEVTALEQIFCFSLNFDFDIEETDIRASLDKFRILE